MKPRNPTSYKKNPPVKARSDGTIWLYGDHPVLAALRNPNRRLRRLVMTAETLQNWNPQNLAHQIKPDVLDRRQIEHLLPHGAVHQGIALQVNPLPALDLETVCRPRPDQDNILVVLDQVTDPHNVGAILRSAAAFGVTGMILPDRNTPEESGIFAKSASGALELVPIVRVVNLARALDQLSALDYWLLGLSGQAERTLSEIALGASPRRIALVLGAEGTGMRRLTEERCDFLARLPIRSEIESLNVSNAAACALYELCRERR